MGLDLKLFGIVTMSRWICPGLTILLLGGLLGEAKTVVQKAAELDVTYADSVTNQIQTIYAFNHTVSRNKTEGVRVTVDVQSRSSHDPVLFVVRQKQAVLSFQVPLILRGLYQTNYPYYDIGRTLCQPPTAATSETQEFFVDVSTLSSRGLSYELRVSALQSFALKTDQKLNFTASPSQPQYFKYVFPEGVDTVLVKVTSDMKFPCSIMSIQDIQCPVRDLDNNVDFLGKYQTITKRGAITVRRKDFPSGSFYVVVVVKAEDEECGGPDEHVDAENRTKILDVVVSPVVYDAGIVYGMLSLCLALILSVCVPILIVDCCKSEQRRGGLSMRRPRPVDTDNVKYLYVSDLAQKVELILSQENQLYPWNLATIAVFYALPVIQLVVAYQTVVNVTGNQDICFYNFLCAHPLGALSSFNNILSNVGYVFLGMIFVLIVLTRQIMHKRAPVCEDAEECGIPKHFGLFYAMAGGLMMEGLLSACYHVCPNYTNFQFDTSFMYMIAGLCMLKLYQKRHPDITPSARTAYVCLAAVVFLSVIGVVSESGSWAFWIIFSLIHVVATLLLSFQLYYTGRWTLAWASLRKCSSPMYIDRLVLLVFGNVVNWSLAIAGLVIRPSDFDSYLLLIAICNLLLYLIYYIIMKLLCGETINWLALFLILFTAVVWGFALFFFFQGLTTWQKTAAESREHNKDCILMSFFDDHDIWHFLSSVAMFGSFLVLLTLDDDLDAVKRDQIHVF